MLQELHKPKTQSAYHMESAFRPQYNTPCADMHCAQAHTIIQSWFNVEDAAENETCRRMELQKMLQQRMKLLENGIAERKESQKMQQKRMEFTGERNYRYMSRE